MSSSENTTTPSLFGNPVRYIADPVHGLIGIDDLTNFLIDQPEFQRLRNIQQLGLCSFVYPTATHTRFQHCIGTYHMAKLWLEALRRDPDLKDRFTEVDAKCVCVAGLYHDLGHGPFSHIWERMSRGRHEKMGIDIFQGMRENPKVKDKLANAGLRDEECRLVEDLIKGKSDNVLLKGKEFLAMIVCNKSVEIDVDKWDYLLRDSFHTCDSMLNLPVQRFYNFLTFKQDSNKQWRTAVAYKDFINVSTMFQHRHLMHRQVYKHKTVTAINEMLLDALKLVDPLLELSQCNNDMKRYLRLTDALFWKIANGEFTESGQPDEHPGQKIVQRILHRDLYKLLATAALPVEKFREMGGEEFVAEWNANNASNASKPCTCVTTECFDLAGETTNPLSNLLVVMKPDKIMAHDQWEKVISPMMYTSVQPEIEIRLFLKHPANEEEMVKIVGEFKKACERFKPFRFI